jgi:hypothetical protein
LAKIPIEFASRSEFINSEYRDASLFLSNLGVMDKFSIKQFLFQILLWLAVALGTLSFKSLFGVPRALIASLLLTLFLAFVTRKLFDEFGREQRFIAVGATLSSLAILLMLIVKFYVVNFELHVLHLVAIFLAPLIVSGLVNGWSKTKKHS